jgi:hypothetical protein
MRKQLPSIRASLPINYNCVISYLMLGNTAKALEQQEKLKAIDPAVANRLASVIAKHQM